MTNCPVCNSKLPDKAKFCPECGVPLTKAPTERAWIIAMQERIKSARHSDSIYNVLAVVGILITVLIPFFVGSVIGMWYDDKNVKALIKQLQKGQEEEPEDNNEDEEETEENTDKKK